MIQPMHDRVLLERIPERKSRIILTDPEPIRKAKVLAIGPDVYDLEVGDIVVLPGIAAEQPDHEHNKQILVQMGDIGCKISEGITARQVRARTIGKDDFVTVFDKRG